MKIFATNPLSESAHRAVTFAVLVTLGWVVCDPVWSDETLDQRRQRVSEFSATEKEVLQRRRDRFDQLPREEKERLRTLHAQIQEHGDSERLLTVLDRYSEWLRTISTSQRADLRKLPVDERIKRIRETKRRFEEERFGRFTSQPLGHEDARIVFDWLDDEFVAGQQPRLEEMLNSRDQQLLRMIEDESRRRALMLRMLYRRNPDIVGDPTPKQIDELVKRLSPEANEKFKAQADPQQQEKLVQQWIQAAIMSRLAPPPVSEKELQEFFATLRPEQREGLERLPRDRMHRELSRMYFQRHTMRRRMGGPPGDGPPRRFGPRNRRGPDHERGRGWEHRPPPPPLPDDDAKPDESVDSPG